MGLGPSSSRPVAVRPVWGWVCFGGLAGVVVHLRDALRGFPRLVGLLAALLEVYLSVRAAGLSTGCLGFYASLLPGEGSWFLRLAWRYGRCFWRRLFPYTWCFPDAGGNVSVSTFLGWFAILEVLVLKSRDSHFSWSLTLLAWCLEFWVPYPVAPLPRVALWFFRSSRGARGAPPDIWPRASVSLLAFDLPLAWSLRLWGDPCLGVQWLSFRVRVLCPLLRHVDVALQDLPCSSVGGLHCPGPVNARIIAWEIVFSMGERSGFLACLGRRIV